MDGVDWEAGTDLDYLRELVEYWQNTFDWRKQEEALNGFAHFMADVDDNCIHFIHERGKGSKRYGSNIPKRLLRRLLGPELKFCMGE